MDVPSWSLDDVIEICFCKFLKLEMHSMMQKSLSICLMLKLYANIKKNILYVMAIFIISLEIHFIIKT